MLWISLDRSKPVPLIRQVYTDIRAKILRGELSAGDKLPSTRKLSEELRISRNVVLEAYDLLLAEGYLESRRGSGHFVAPGIRLDAPAADVAGSERAWTAIDRDSDDGVIDFRSGVPALDHFPRDVWAKVVQRACREAPLSALGYGRPEGRAELRRILSRYLYRTRGVQCRPEQIVITSGATQALSLIAKVLLSPGCSVLLEDPITLDIQTIFSSAGAVLHPIPVDEQGMMTDCLPSGKFPRFVLVTPSHQFPLGGTLPIQRRIQLIRYARDNDCYIVEDDYDSEFRYDSPPINALQGLAEERVIYVGSFSKILSPALRMGYLVLPPALVERYQEAKWFTDLHTPSLDQLALGLFVEEGHLEKTINRVKKVYKKRRQALCDALYAHFPEQVSTLGSSTGLHIVAAFRGTSFTPELLTSLQTAGVRVYPVEAHAIVKGRHHDKIILGYGNLTEADIAEGVRRMKKVLG